MNNVQTDIVADVTRIVGEHGLASAAAYAIDGMAPAVVVVPDSVEQVSRLLAYANATGLAVVPWGGGTAMPLGNRPRRLDLVVALSRLERVLDYSPEDMTITLQAGATLAQAQATMASSGQMLPLDPPQPGKATIGGILATNASGPLRYQFGMPRDLALGTVVVYADGTVAKSGGRTVKNVAGYDMSRLHIGAFGTLGIIVEATFKVSPIPKKLATIAGRFDTLTSAAGAARALRLARIVPWSLALAGPGVLPGAATGYTVAVRLGGQAAVVDPQAQRALDTLKEAQASSPAMLDDAEDNLWPVVRDWPDLAAGADGILVRMGLAPSQVLNVMTAAGDVAARHGLHAQMLAHPGAATIHLCLSGPGDKAVDAVAGLVAVVKEWNGNLVVERCPSALKDRLPVWGLAASDALSQRVKETFDPKGTLNPGRFVGS